MLLYIHLYLKFRQLYILFLYHFQIYSNHSMYNSNCYHHLMSQNRHNFLHLLLIVLVYLLDVFHLDCYYHSIFFQLLLQLFLVYVYLLSHLLLYHYYFDYHMLLYIHLLQKLLLFHSLFHYHFHFQVIHSMYVSSYLIHLELHFQQRYHLLLILLECYLDEVHLDYYYHSILFLLLQLLFQDYMSLL